MLGQLLGKYAAFIVPAFAVTVVAFAGMIALSVNHARRWRKRYEELSRQGAPRS
jgi:heme exporter protein CcmD